MIRLRVPGTLAYHDVAVRLVTVACESLPAPVLANFRDHVVSAFMEAFNNIILHAYEPPITGDIEVEIEVGLERLTIRMSDFGVSFDRQSVPTPDFDALAESGYGIFIIQSFMDEVEYRDGAPNVLTMSKRFRSSEPRPDGGAP